MGHVGSEYSWLGLRGMDGYGREERRDEERDRRIDSMILISDGIVLWWLKETTSLHFVDSWLWLVFEFVFE